MEGAVFISLLQELPQLSQWLASNDHVLWWLAAVSLLVFLASLVMIPWIIVRIPPDYFERERRSALSTLLRGHPVMIAVVGALRNSLAVILIVLGVLLLVLPGQGLLTIFVGVVIADFPGKHRFVNWLVARRAINRPINWLRRRAGKQPVNPPR